MSYQVNFRLFIPDCTCEEAEAASKLQREFHEAAVQVMQRNGFHSKHVGLTSAEVAHLKN